jgi:hypothetical protein
VKHNGRGVRAKQVVVLLESNGLTYYPQQYYLLDLLAMLEVHDLK